MISVILHTEGDVIAEPLPIAEISEALKRPDVLLWVDVVDPSPGELSRLQEEFSFHPLALEDVAKGHQRPKIDYYQGVAFIVFYRLSRGADKEIRTDQIGLFYGENYLVTVHRDVLPELGELCDRWALNVRHIHGSKVGLLLYSVLDLLVDEYMPLLDTISDEIDAVQEQIFDDFDSSVQRRAFQLKKSLLTIRRIVAPERDVLNQLMRIDEGVLASTPDRYLADVYDHLLRVQEATDLYRELLSGAMDSYLAAASNRLSEVMYRLTASSIILMGMTLVAGIYGMNFVHMPELGWLFGYPFALGLMAAIGLTLMVVFRRIDWL